jgi:hypothetical protein
MKNMDGERNIPDRCRLNFVGMAAVALLANLVSTELHESLHLIVGRLCGLPAHFLGLTSVGVSPSIAATARPSALALMNGVAPLATMLLGIVALFAVPWLRRRAPATVTAFVAWCAIFAVPYIGLQTMTASLPAHLRGNGADSAAVIGGYFGVPVGMRAVISIVGLILFMASGFFLGRAVSDDSGDEPCCLPLRQHLRGLARWRVAAASILGLLVVAMTVRGAFLLAWSKNGGFFSLLIAIWLWGAMMTLLVRWQAPGAREVRDRWIFPGLPASFGLLAMGLFTHDDLFTSATIYVIPLVATAWVLTRGSVEMVELSRV